MWVWLAKALSRPNLAQNSRFYEKPKSDLYETTANEFFNLKNTLTASKWIE